MTVAIIGPLETHRSAIEVIRALLKEHGFEVSLIQSVIRVNLFSKIRLKRGMYSIRDTPFQIPDTLRPEVMKVLQINPP